MSDSLDMHLGPAVDPSLRPDPATVRFDLEHALLSIVSLHTKIPESAFTASSLGDERSGHGVLIGDNGLILTIGYLIIEAETVWLLDGRGRAVQAHVVGYDQETGFGLVQALERLDLPVMELGSSAALDLGDSVIVAGNGGVAGAVAAEVVAKQEFAGYWEYVLDEALFTAPPHPFWGGAGLIDRHGRLGGIGSLFVQHNPGTAPSFDGNMVVPIDLLKPILDNLSTMGRSGRPPRPWLGLITAEADGKIVVAGLADGGPAERADIRVGDLVVGVGGAPVTGLAAMFRRIWSMGGAGVEVPLTVYRDGDALEINVRSGDRSDFLVSPRLH